MKSFDEFAKAMETSEMQEAFEKFSEGKTVSTAEDADKLVKEFAAENGYDISESSVKFVSSDENLSEEELAEVAGGRDIRNVNAQLGRDIRNVNLFFARDIRNVNLRLACGLRDDNGISLRGENCNLCAPLGDENASLKDENASLKD